MAEILPFETTFFLHSVSRALATTFNDSEHTYTHLSIHYPNNMIKYSLLTSLSLASRHKAHVVGGFHGSEGRPSSAAALLPPIVFSYIDLGHGCV